MVLSFLPRYVNFDWRFWKETKTQQGNVLRLIQIRLPTSSLAKIKLGSQTNSAQRGSPDQAAGTVPPTVETSIAKVTAALLLPLNARI